jgi:hypothetical protein
VRSPRVSARWTDETETTVPLSLRPPPGFFALDEHDRLVVEDGGASAAIATSRPFVGGRRLPVVEAAVARDVSRFVDEGADVEVRWARAQKGDAGVEDVVPLAEREHAQGGR